MPTPVLDSDNFTLADFADCDSPDLFAKAERFNSFLTDWKGKGTYGFHRLVTSACANTAMLRDRATHEDRDMVVLASNNYLGLSTRPEVVEAARAAIAKYGTGMCGSRFLSGTYDLIEELESRLARFENKEAALVFTTGYQANVGTISALLRSKDVAYIDKLCHASIVDGCRLAGCATRSFRHNDLQSLERLLEKTKGKYRGSMIIVDGVFSMDGDMAPLPGIVDLAERYGARVLVDEAHSTGVLGDHGGGAVEHFGVRDRVDIILGTFSKTFASTGGFIAGRRDVIEYVRQYARSYIFTASPTPANSAAVLAGLTIIENEPQLRVKLWENIHYFHGQLKALGFRVFPDPPESAIMTVIVGPDITVRQMGTDLFNEGIFANIVFYPAVPPNKGTLRISLSANHTHKDLDRALYVLGSIGERYGLLSA
ncbi:MAG: aminotransferase class I/II-fold pyridoxal phosphate-dependent enzyme [Verrucomicrobia bacterium]|jgi:glycine C-acetyltransferase|nr:aminotransferase class I/II-fold pyridoxal phosphate-dependent enzyme [Verrucomicrobiota bacterium]